MCRRKPEFRNNVNQKVKSNIYQVTESGVNSKMDLKKNENPQKNPYVKKKQDPELARAKVTESEPKLKANAVERTENKIFVQN
ncbi:hypothetical protein ACTXT7_001030 [Hymenolepis weldensis]